MTLIKTNDRKLGRKFSTQWARVVLNNPDVLYLDLETNTLPKDDNDVVDILTVGIVDNNDSTLLDILLRTNKPIDPGASEAHGIDWHMMRNSAVTFKDLLPVLYKMLDGRLIICYNAEFDINQIIKNFRRYNHPVPEFTYDCAMHYFSQYCGLWNKRRNDWKWQRLPNLADGKAHTCINDARSTKKVLELMATDKPLDSDIDLDF